MKLTVQELAQKALQQSAGGVVAEIVDPDLVSMDLTVRRAAAAKLLSADTQAALLKMAEIVRTGGRNYAAALRVFAELAWGIGAEHVDTVEAKKASELYERVRELDQRGVLQVACAFIQQYLEKYPSEQRQVLTMIGIKEA